MVTHKQENRYANDHLVASRLINQLRGGGDIRTPVEMQKLSEVKNAYMNFESMRQLDEVDRYTVHGHRNY